MRKHAFALFMIMLVAFAFIPWYMSPSARAGTTIFNDGFESGTFLTTDVPPGAWTSLAVGGGSSTTITTDSPHHGSYNAKFIVGSYSWSCAKKSFAELGIAFVRAYYTFTTLPGIGERVYLTELRSNNDHDVQVVLENVSGSLFWALIVTEGGTAYTTYEMAPSNPTTGVSYCVELKRDVTNGLEELWIDGVSKVSDDASITDNSTEIVIGYGYNTAVNQQTCYVDCVVVADAYIGPEGSDSIPPTFGNISASATVAGQSCSLNCLINDDTNVSAYIFSTNNTGLWTNVTAVAFSSFFNETAAWADVTKTLNETVGNVVCCVWYANDTSDNWGHSDQYNLTLTALYRPNLQMTPDSAICRKYLETFSVQINVTNAINIQAFNFTIYYDPSVLNYSSVSWGELGFGTMTRIDITNGILEGNVAGSPINGNYWLLNITFQAGKAIIWKNYLANRLEGKIWFHEAQLNFTDNSKLQYVEGGINQIDVNQANYTFLPIRGDINNDGTVNISDLSTVAFYYDKTPADPLWSEASTYDLNGDHTIDIFDLVFVASNFWFTYP